MMHVELFLTPDTACSLFAKKEYINKTHLHMQKIFHLFYSLFVRLQSQSFSKPALIPPFELFVRSSNCTKFLQYFLVLATLARPLTFWNLHLKKYCFKQLSFQSKMKINEGNAYLITIESCIHFFHANPFKADRLI